MKQLMVLVATIVLGISISGIVLGFGEQASTISENVGSGITSLATEFNEVLTPTSKTE